MRKKIYSKEFKLAMLHAFPAKGQMLKIVLDQSRRLYGCDGCQHPEITTLLTVDNAGYPATHHARKTVYEHFKTHESPTVDFKTMTNFGRRA